MNNQYQYPQGAQISQSTMPPIQNIPVTSDQGILNNPSNTQDPYAENILQKNVGNYAEFYMSYADSIEWKDKVFKGTIMEAGRDYVLLEDAVTKRPTLLWIIYLDYVIF